MTAPHHQLTLIDLMAAVVAAALGMGFIMWDPPPPSVPALVVIFWLTVPLVPILWDRWRGRRGILGGALGGAAEVGFALLWVATGPHRPGQMGPSHLVNDPIGAVSMIAGFLIFGTLMGVVVWLVAAMMGRSVAPALPSPDDRFVRPQ